MFLTIKNNKHMIKLSGKLICMRGLLWRQPSCIVILCSVFVMLIEVLVKLFKTQSQQISYLVVFAVRQPLTSLWNMSVGKRGKFFSPLFLSWIHGLNAVLMSLHWPLFPQNKRLDSCLAEESWFGILLLLSGLSEFTSWTFYVFFL